MPKTYKVFGQVALQKNIEFSGFFHFFLPSSNSRVTNPGASVLASIFRPRFVVSFGLLVNFHFPYLGFVLSFGLLVNFYFIYLGFVVYFGLLVIFHFPYLGRVLSFLLN